jgi:DNA gyrase/topoisomerase IV subunit B
MVVVFQLGFIKKEGVSVLEVVMTKIGLENFDKDSMLSGGLHGVGVSGKCIVKSFASYCS